MPLETTQHFKIKDFLKKHAPFSVIDRGMSYAEGGGVSECSLFGGSIQGIVKDENGATHAVRLNILSGCELNATCTCCSPDDLCEQWCAHVVALLWRAHDLDFFDPSGGFAPLESKVRLNTSSPEDIAAVINEVGKTPPLRVPDNLYLPEVSILLDLRRDQLGIQLAFDGRKQIPNIFSGFALRSARALDNILLQVLEDEGHWDEQHGLWFVNSSRGIETVLGLVQEYKDVVSLPDYEPITFSHDLLNAKLSIEWLDTSAELVLYWVLPDGSVRNKENEVLGTGPYWTMVANTIYRISPEASRLASIFPYSATITIPRHLTGPILESLQDHLYHPEVVQIINPESQPKCLVKDPTPNLELKRIDTHMEHFASQQRFEIEAYLKFDYPSPPSTKNIVYLPNRTKEGQFTDFLKSLGFVFDHEHKRYLISGDAALDLVYQGMRLFPSPWKVKGLKEISLSTHFAELSLNVALSAPTSTPIKGSRTQGLHWFDCQISLTQNNSNVPISILFKNTRSDNERWLKLDGGAYARVPGQSLSHLKTTLGMIDPNFKLRNTIKSKISCAQALSFSRMEDPGFQIRSDRTLCELSNKLRDFDNITHAPTPQGFKGKLRPYQIEGLSWLKFLHDFSLSGVLADEMGLGKTVQTLALLQLLKENSGRTRRRPSLIIAPTSVIMNWSYEAKRFCPGLKALLLHGSQRKQRFALINQYDIVITSYALLRLDWYELQNVDWHYIILDEAQNIKNPLATTTKAAKMLKASHRLALSGTPTENRPLELWSIFDFLMPGYLGSQEFFKNYMEKPILESGPQVEITKILRQKTKPFVLRRMKADVERDLPPKIETTLHVPMTHSQKQLYAQILEEVRPRVFDAMTKRGVAGASVSILSALLRLRQVCNHPNSIECLREAPGYDSGKFRALQELTTEALEAGHKILLFSQFREMLAIIRRWLEVEKVNYLYLDGLTKERQHLVDRFNLDSQVRLFLISLKAGGLGLNLTAADTVIIYDPWWNPAVEGQAVDRAHRIGQNKRVNVYRLVTENSIEQKIMELKGKKARIVDALVNEGGLSTLKLTKADLENLFSPFPAE